MPKPNTKATAMMRDLPPIFVLRHGETEWNREGRCQGHLDAPLTELGRAQAQAQGRILRDQIIPHYPALEVLVSPLGRTRATWEIVAGVAGLDDSAATMEPKLAEVHMGAWQGRLREEFLAEDAQARAHPNLFELSVNTPGGEPFEALCDRVQDCLNQIKGPTICVTHGITSQVLRGLVQGLDRPEMAAQDHAQGIIYALIEGRERRLHAHAPA